MVTHNHRFLAASALVAVLAAACGSSSSTAAAPATGAPTVRTVTMELTTGGCTPAALSLPAGPTKFVVTNGSAATINEFEIHHGANIVAEAESVTPGVTKAFAITLQPGRFTTVCKGGTVETKPGALVVTGHAPKTVSRVSAADAARAVAKYRSYLEQQADLLVARTTPFVAAVRAGDIAKAKQLYAPARIPYERIEPVSESFGDLDPRIDARINDVPAGHWSGFHRIEQALYAENDVTAMGPTAQQLLADVTTLDRRVHTVHLEPASVANGAVALLNEVTASKITGEEERYSHIDLVDLVGNVEGSQAAFDAVASLLPPGAPVSAKVIDGRFGSLFAVLAPFKRGDGYVLYSDLTATNTRAISQATDATAEPLSRVAELIIT